MYTALYRAYRPEVFDQLLGQEHITKILKNQLASGTTSHAYLFCGTRGTGKTTTARLLAKGLNCTAEGERPCGKCPACQSIRDGNFLDVVEIDAASNRGIDDIRQLRDSVNYPPVVGRHKVYIIDEVHMLSTEAFNALLKTLEEPPEYVTFILATTEPRKLPATILSRCLRLDFKRVPENVLIRGMKQICEDIGIQVTEPALRIIAANADGSVRDGLSILDQCISGGDKTVDAPDVLDFLGASGEEVFITLTDMISKRRTAEAIEYLDSVLADGKDVRQLIRDWISHYRNLMMTRFIRDPQAVINLSAENIDRVRQQSSVMELEDITRGIMELSKTADAARWSTQPRILLEVCMVNLCQGAGTLPMRRPGEPGDAGKDALMRGGIPGGRMQRQAAPGNAAQRQAAPDVALQRQAAPLDAPQAAPRTEPTDDPDESAGTLDALDAMIAAARKNPAQQESSAMKDRPAQQEQPQARMPSGPQNAAAFREEPMPEEEYQDEAPMWDASMWEAATERPDAQFADAGTLGTQPVDAGFPDPQPMDAGVDAGMEPGVPEAGSPGAGVPDTDLVTLWDQVFADGEHAKGSFYLIRSNGMLTAMDDNTFTVTVKNELHRRQTERNRQLLEDIMEARTGRRRILQVRINESGSGEPSVEEAAAWASEVLGVNVEIR